MLDLLRVPKALANLTARRLWMGGWVVLIALGLFFRVYHLDHQVYWVDEVNTTLRTLGYTTREVEETLLTGELFRSADLQAFQQPSADRGWLDTWRSLTGSPEHTPLYFLLSRQWVAWFGSSVATWRSIAAVFGVLVFPAVYGLAWELFRNPWVAWGGVAWVAITPVHVLYAQEARPYSLLTLLTALSSALLLRAMRTARWGAWLGYGLTVVLGLYTQLLFGAVAIAHGLYVLLMQGGRLTASTRRYLLVTGGAIALLSPWLWILANSFAKVQRKTRSLGDDRYSLGELLDRWFRVLNQMTVDWELAGWNIVLLLVAIAATVLLCRNTPKHTWLFLLLLGWVPFLLLALPDLVLGGERSLRVRYLLPSALSLHLVLAFALSYIIPAKRRTDIGFQVVFVALLMLQIASCTVTSQRLVWWNKSRPTSSYYQPTAARINRTPQAKILTQSKVSDLIAWSYWLAPNTLLQYLPTDTLPDISDRPILYLHYPSPDLVAQQKTRLSPVYPANNAVDPILWALDP